VRGAPKKTDMKEKGPPWKLDRGRDKEKGPPQKLNRGRDMKGDGNSAPPTSKPSNIYPTLDLEALEIDSSDSDELDSSEEAELEEEAAKYERERYGPYPKVQQKVKIKGGIQQLPKPSAPPSYQTSYGTSSFLPQEELKKIRKAFPVFDARDGAGRIHAPAEYQQIKELAESVCNYGVNTNFTLVQVERFANVAMTPADWQMTVKATLPNMGQYMEWKALWYDAAQNQARINAAAEDDNQRQWTFELLMGQGQYAANQTNYHWGEYAQISAAAIKAWKALTRKGEAGGHLTKIIQGPQEPFSDFVARM
jgi:hypothetical protein